MEDINNNWAKLCRKSVKYMEEKIAKLIQRIRLLEYVFKYVMQIPLLYSGSRAEGIHSASSDTDFMFEAEDVIATDWNMKNEDESICTVKIHYSSEVHPGYTKLEVQDGHPDTSEFHVYGNGLFTLCCVNSKFLSNVLVTEYWKKRMRKVFDKQGRQDDSHQHGPSVTCSYFCGGKLADVDRVLCFKADWPKMTDELFKRERRYGWPNEKLRNKIRDLGCNVGPVGHAHSNNPELEWRFSFSKAERELVWSFNPTQYECINVMKMFFQQEINPEFPELFSSYFIKTSMFWMIEETSCELWKPDNLLLCLDMLLARLIVGVENKCIYNYFIRSNNMLDAKPPNDLERMQERLCVFERLGRQIWKPYLEFRIDQRQKHDLYYYHTEINGLSLSRHFIYDDFKRLSLEKMPAHILGVIQELKRSKDFGVCCDISSILIKELETTYRESLYRLSQENYTPNQHDLRHAFENSLKEMQNSDFCSGRLQLAWYYLREGQCRESLQIIDEVINHYDNRIIHYTFWQRKTDPVPALYVTTKPRKGLEVTVSQYIALDIILLPVLCYGVTNPVSTLLEQNVVVFIEPLFFAQLLKFLCELELRNFLVCQVCVENMRDLVAKKTANFESSETSSLKRCIDTCYSFLAEVQGQGKDVSKKEIEHGDMKYEKVNTFTKRTNTDK